MGLIISRFRKKKSTKEVLEQIQKDVVQIEEYGASTQQRQKRLVGSLVLYSAIFYLIAVAVYYFYYFPATTQDRLLYASPFVVFPVLIYLLKRLLSWYYRRKIAKNELKLKKLRDQKEQILEQVMEVETYKVAKEILELYAPDQLRKTQPLPKMSPTPAPRMPIHSPQHSEVRRRVVNSPPQVGGGQGGMRPVSPQTLHHQTPVFPSRAPIMAQSAPGRPIPGPGSSVRAPLLHGPPSHRHTAGPVNPSYSTPAVGLHAGLPRPDPSSGDGGPPGPPMPRPVLPRERGYFDRFVEYLVGDGPANRFALVCRQCESHNGMALKDEFPYLAFRCAYCYYWNPARKQRPCAPRLEELMPQPPPALAAQDAQEDEDEEEDEEEEEQESSSEEEDEEDDDEGEEGGVDEEESGGSSSGEEEEGAASSSEQSSTKATSSQEGSLEDVAKSSPTSGTSTDPSSTSEDQLHHPQCTANMCPTTSSTTTSTSNTTSPSATENEETE